MVETKKVFDPLKRAMEAHLGEKVGDVYESVFLPLMASSSSEDRIIRDSGKNVVAIEDSFSKRWNPLVGEAAVDVPENKNNLLTKRSWMSRNNQKLYGARNDRFNEANDANKAAVAHNGVLADKLADGEINAKQYKEQKLPIVDAEAIKSEIPKGLTEGFATRQECIDYLKKSGVKLA